MVQKAGGNLVCDNRFHRGRADPHFPPMMMCCPINCAGAYLRLKNRRHRLSFVLQTAFDPPELWSIEGGHLHHRQSNPALVVNEFAAQRIGEARDCVFGSTVSGLQWDTAISQRRPNLNNRAVIARQHPLQRSQGAVNHAKIRHLSDTLVFFRLHFFDRRENRCHGIIDPYVNGSELSFYRGGGLLDLSRIRHVRR